MARGRVVHTESMLTADLLTRLAAQGEAFARAIEAGGPNAPVPSCPEWTVRDLAAHLGEVHRWAAFNVAHPGVRPGDDLRGPMPGDDDLGEWLRAGCRQLIDTLNIADPHGEYYTFLVDVASPHAFWVRRQAHETAMHTVDAQLASGPADDIDGDFAADGIDELLTGFLPRKHTKFRSDTVRTLLVAPTDSDLRWHLTVSTEPVVTVRAEARAECTLAGRATDLYKVLWNRPGNAAVAITGETDLFEHFQNSVFIRWS